MIFLTFPIFAFSQQKGIFGKYFNDNIISMEASGSSQQIINMSLQTTKPEYAIYPWDKKYDWTSNCVVNEGEHPWILFKFDRRKIKLTGYFMRAGCCYEHECCCYPVGNYCVTCCLYSWTLQVSNDNKNWTDAHKVEGNFKMERCGEETYTLDKEYEARYVRVTQIEPCPGNPPCMAINKLELYGEVNEILIPDEIIEFNDDEDISIIGHVYKIDVVK